MQESTPIPNDQLFHLLFIAIFLGMLFISGYFRYRARQSGEVIPRAREGKPAVLGRLLFAAPLFLSIFAYMLNPQWMAWSSLLLPDWLRWLAAAVGLAMLPMIYWMFRSIGKNISETFLTKESHVLVTHGPYRWIRHPLYTFAMIGLISLSLLAANWFMLLLSCLAFIGIAAFVVPREEAELGRKFGEAYRVYQERTGRFIPRLPL